jgi:7-carboxy-7-deazaguanine synthase (Cx14CxxC type)
MYAVKEIFYTLQGEGAQSGRAAVFLRFAGCNLWSGREQDRAAAVCRFCDTDFVGTDGTGGGKFADAEALSGAVARQWPEGRAAAAGARRYVVCTGGEPLLQLDAPLIDALHVNGFEIAIETNGTLPAPPGIDWICVSPKGRAPLVQRSGHELKFVFPQTDAAPEGLEHLDFRHFFIQPMDGPHLQDNIAASAAYCMTHPRWRLSLQMHKLAGIP